MKVFVDANVLVSVLNKEYPLFTYSSRILSLSDTHKFQIYTSPICLAIAFYFSQKKYKKEAKQKIKILSDNLFIAAATEKGVKNALANVKVNDFEDGLEYYSAVENNCECIVTEDTNDFYFADIEVLNCQDFALKYMRKKY